LETPNEARRNVLFSAAAVSRSTDAANTHDVPLAQQTGVLEPLADTMRWDWRTLQRCAQVNRAWFGTFSQFKHSLPARLASALTKLHEEHAASPLAVDLQEQQRDIIGKTNQGDLRGVCGVPKPPAPCAENLCLTLHVAGVAQHPESPLTSWLPGIGELSDSNRSSWIGAHWREARRAIFGVANRLGQRPPKGQMPALFERLLELRVINTPPRLLEDLRAWRHEPCTSRDAMLRKCSACGQLAEWMQALVAEWELLRGLRVDAADAPKLLALQAELAEAEARAEKERGALTALEAEPSAQEREELRRRLAEDAAVSDELRAKLAIDVALKGIVSRTIGDRVHRWRSTWRSTTDGNLQHTGAAGASKS